jgi:hypothetical protein
MNIQVCRLCLLEKASDESMVDIFGSISNEIGKSNFCDKIDERINWISGLKVSRKNVIAKNKYFNPYSTSRSTRTTDFLS